MTTTPDPKEAASSEGKRPHRYFGPDPDKTRLRATVASIGKEIESLPGHAPVPGMPPSVLVAAYAELVKALALGPEPKTQACPSCGTIGMRAATICGNCWTPLTPAPSAPAE